MSKLPKMPKILVALRSAYFKSRRIRHFVRRRRISILGILGI